MTRTDRTSLYKDPDKAVIFGICAGLADYLNVKRALVRIVAVFVAFGWFWIIFPIYIVAYFVLDDKPKDLYRDERDAEFWRTARNRPDVTEAGMRSRFRDIDRRMQRLEKLMTSKRYRLERELKDLEN